MSPVSWLRRVGAFAAGAGAVSMALASAPTAAHAQEESKRVQAGNGDGMDLHLFQPAVDSKGFFSVNGADILGAGDISLGLVLDYGYRIMPLNEGHGADELLTHAFQGTLQFDYGIGNLVVVGISAPVLLSDGDSVTDVGPTGGTYDDDQLEGQALGHIALHGKLRIIDPSDGFGLAVIAKAGVETADSADFATEPTFFYWPQAVVEGRAGIWRLGVNAGFKGHVGENPQFGDGADGEPQLENGTLEYGNLVTAGLGTSLRVLEPLDLVAETYASFLVGSESDSKQTISAEAIGGIKLFIEKRSYLMIAGGPGYAPGFQTATARGTIGFVFEPSIGDRDGDGIKDDVDDCPDQPEDFDGFQDTRGDSPDGEYGCPDPDNDQDGIPDVDDSCPNNPEDRDGDEDDDGCPEGDTGDRDGDGILDVNDKCPDDPEDKDGFEDRDGCPDPDNDKDGIPDVEDRCPNDPEDKDGVEDEDGCPEPDPDKKVIIEGNEIMILEKILFETGSAKILESSNGILDAVAETLKEHPEFELVEVGGHADARSNDAFNLRLTKQRVKSVVDALGKRGVPASRLVGQGYGEYCPLDAAENEEAWEKNRRVEFKVLKTSGSPTEVETGCQAARDKGIVTKVP
jgi:outer membrane protein OmpA-like peptidoglycan-associated protein